MNEDRGNWYLITAIVLGFSLGLFYAWSVSPAGLEESYPHMLRSDYKDAYRAMIASAYDANRDLARAKSRLALLKDEDEGTLSAQAQRILAEGGDYQEAQTLANLSAALLGNPPPADSPTPTAVPATSRPEPSPTDTASPIPPSPTVTASPSEDTTPTTTPTATLTPTPLPTFTPTLTPISPFILENDEAICDPALTTPLIQIYATDKKGDGVPGVKVLALWGDNQQESFFTGLKPEFGYGYADFEMVPGTVYHVEFPQSGVTVTEIETTECSGEAGKYWGSWQIFITQPE